LNWAGLLKGEVILTANVIFGVLAGEAICRLRWAERLMNRLMPLLRALGVGPMLGTAMIVGIGSSKAGATLLARGVEEERISRKGAAWGVISLSFPAYLRRWPSTFALCASMAGAAGVIFAVILLLRSLGRFLFVAVKARGSEQDSGESAFAETRKLPPSFWIKRLFTTLPMAWVFYAAAFLAIPRIEALLRDSLGGGLLPVAGWGVASAAFAGISASLALARGARTSGDLNTAEAVFARRLGNGLGYFTRALRQNAGYFFGIMPADISRSILIWNMVTMLPFVALSLAVSALFVLL
jgi:hypothetical protein